MTDPVNKISGVRETGKKNTQEGLFKNDRHRPKSAHDEGDSIDISDEARDKASGKKRKNILEYIES